jgi:hypothetical protein
MWRNQDGLERGGRESTAAGREGCEKELAHVKKLGWIRERGGGERERDYLPLDP